MALKRLAMATHYYAWHGNGEARHSSAQQWRSGAKQRLRMASQRGDLPRMAKARRCAAELCKGFAWQGAALICFAKAKQCKAKICFAMAKPGKAGRCKGRAVLSGEEQCKGLAKRSIDLHSNGNATLRIASQRRCIAELSRGNEYRR